MSDEKEVRNGELSGVVSFGFICTGTLRGLQSPKRLLATAERLTDSGENEVAVIVAVTACEVVVESVMHEAFPVDETADYIRSYSLTGRKRLKQYKQLTNDNIELAPFWPDYLWAAKCRHECVHRGFVIDPVSVRRAINVANVFVEHVSKHLP
jgi:hypothetical protein